MRSLPLGGGALVVTLHVVFVGDYGSEAGSGHSIRHSGRETDGLGCTVVAPTVPHSE